MTVFILAEGSSCDIHIWTVTDTHINTYTSVMTLNIHWGT